MIKFRSPFYRIPATIIWVQCDHCGKKYQIAINNIRRNNYCTECK